MFFLHLFLYKFDYLAGAPSDPRGSWLINLKHMMMIPHKRFIFSGKLVMTKILKSFVNIFLFTISTPPPLDSTLLLGITIKKKINLKSQPPDDAPTQVLAFPAKWFLRKRFWKNTSNFFNNLKLYPP